MQNKPDVNTIRRVWDIVESTRPKPWEGKGKYEYIKYTSNQKLKLWGINLNNVLAERGK